MHIQAGCEYLLKIDKELLSDPIVWVNTKKFSSKYTKWGDIDGKIATIKSRTRILSVYYIATISEIPDDSFYVAKSFLRKLSLQDTAKCVCELRALMNKGCQCGAFQKEKDLII